MTNNSVFFLGAGFSKAICDFYPDLSNLSEEISIDYMMHDTTDPISSHFANNVPEEYRCNLELLLTYLSNNLPYKTDVQISMADALYKDITKKIADKFYTMPNKFKNFLVNCNNIVHYIWENSCPCITLNYDLLLENLIYRSYQAYNKAVAQGGFINFYHYSINNLYKNNINEYIKLDLLNLKPAGKIHLKSMPNIIKLHGSINWQLTDFSSSGILQYEDDYNESMLSPFIIPPILDKTKLYENLTLKKCWNQAYESLKNARKIFIYGFSFPQTDLAIKFLFQSALRHNHKFKIYVINTKDMVDENSQYYAKDRYQNIFARYDIDFKYCCDDSLKLFNNDIYAL